jgi:hypothetical protein
LDALQHALPRRMASCIDTVVESVAFIIRVLTLLECYIDTVVESVAFIIVVLTLLESYIDTRVESVAFIILRIKTAINVES